MSKSQCKLCNDIIESKHQHDFVECKCGEIFLDGGDEYLRFGARDINNVIFTNFIIDESKEERL